jgi:DNA-directed RNA polymerase specialized sigma24 family protein
VGSKVAALDQLGDTVAVLREAQAARDRAVAVAVVSGATWAEIAEVLGVSVSAAHKRFRWVRVDADTGVVWREPPLSN